MKNTVKKLVVIGVGAIIMALSMRLFLVPNKIAPGGVSGLATIIQYVTNIPAGTFMLCINIPLFLLALKDEGWKFVLYTLYGVAVMSLGTDYLPVPCVSDNLFLSTIFGGLIMGFGLGLMLRAGGSSGGTALMAQLVHKFVPFISIAWVMFAIDFIVVALSGVLFTLELALYSTIALFIVSKVVDMVVEGFNAAKSIYIISDQKEEIARRILEDVDRGCTRISATGTFSGAQKDVLMCVLKSSRELVQVKAILKEIDPEAFVFVSEVREVMGEGFIEMAGH